MEVELSSLGLLVSGVNQSWVRDGGLMVVFPNLGSCPESMGMLKA